MSAITWKDLTDEHKAKIAQLHAHGWKYNRIADLVGVSQSTMTRWGSRLGLRKRRIIRARDFDDRAKQLLLSKYNGGMTQDELADQYGTTKELIGKVLRSIEGYKPTTRRGGKRRDADTYALARIIQAECGSGKTYAQVGATFAMQPQLVRYYANMEIPDTSCQS